MPTMATENAKSFPEVELASTVADGPLRSRDVFAILTALLLSTAAGRLPAKLVMLHDPVDPDLPCPWCRCATIEDDPICPSCGQHFG